MLAGTVGLGAVAVVVASLIPAVAIAGPMLDFGERAAPDRSAPAGHHLEADDWLQLSARRDHGWHLGWFKSATPRDGSDLWVDQIDDDVDVVDFDPIVWDVIPLNLVDGISPNTVLPEALSPESSNVGDGGASPNIIAVPEPTSMVLLGSGLLLMARRLRKVSR